MLIFLEFTSKPIDSSTETGSDMAVEKGQTRHHPALSSAKFAMETINRIRQELDDSLPGFNSRVALRFLATQAGLGWEGAVLLAQRHGDPESWQAQRSFAAAVIEGAVDRAVRVIPDSLQTDSTDSVEIEDAMKTRILSRESRGETVDSSAPASQWYQSTPTWGQSRFAFATAMIAMALSAFAFFGFAYLVFKG